MSASKIAPETSVVVVLKDEAVVKDKPLPPVLPCFSPREVKTTVEFMTSDDEEEDEEEEGLVLKLTGAELGDFIEEMDETPVFNPRLYLLPERLFKVPKKCPRSQSLGRLPRPC